MLPQRIFGQGHPEYGCFQTRSLDKVTTKSCLCPGLVLLINKASARSRSDTRAGHRSYIVFLGGKDFYFVFLSTEL
jgi:hypothetical protein